MRRRSLIALLIVAMLLPGCGGRATPEPVSIAFACQDYQRDTYQELATEFMAQQARIAVRLVSYAEATGNDPGVATSDDLAKVAAVADAFPGTSFDIDNPSLRAAILDLTDLAEEDGALDRSDFYTGMLSLGERDGRLLALPYAASLTLLFFDPAVLADAGAQAPTIGWTWDNLVQAATLATTRVGDQVTRYGFVDRNLTDTLTALAHGKAGPLTEAREDGFVLHLAEPAVADALRWYLDLYRELAVMPDPSSGNHQALDELVYSGHPAMWTAQSFELGNFVNMYDTAIAPLPGDGTPLWAQAYFVSAGTAHPEAAWRWIEFLTRSTIGPTLGLVPVRRSQVGADYWEALGEQRSEVLRYCLDHPLAYPRLVGTALASVAQEALAGEDVETALASAQARTERQIAMGAAPVASPVAAVAVPTPAPTGSGSAVRFGAFPGADMEALRTIAEQYNVSHPEAKVVVQPGTQGRLAISAAAADCFADYTWLLAREGTSSLLALDPFVDSHGYDLTPYGKQLLAAVRRGGSLWALPLQTDYRFLFYNKDLLDSLGVAYPAPGGTPAGLVETALAATDTAADPPVYGFLPRDGIYADVPGYLGAFGGSLVGPDGGLTLDDASVVGALSLLAELAGAMPPPALEYRNVFGSTVSSAGGHPPLVASGQLAMWVDDYLGHTYAPPLDFAVGVAALPVGGTAMTGSGMVGLYVSATAARPDACWEWLTYLAEQPEAVTLLPARLDVAGTEEWRSGERVGDEVAHAWVEVLDAPAAATGPAEVLESLPSYWLTQALYETIGGRLPEEALSEAQARTQAFRECTAEAGDADEAAYEACAVQADPGVVLP